MFSILIISAIIGVVENYRNQTYKMISAINYISDYCPGLKLILRIDDDIVFHPSLLLSKLISIMSINRTSEQAPSINLSTISHNAIACHVISDFEVWRRKDHPKHYNVVDDDVLPNELLYPPFCAGFFVAMSGDVPKMMQPHIATEKPFWMDDRYMGVLQKRAATHNLDIKLLLDYGYRDVKRRDLNLFVDKKVLVRHLPSNLELHLSAIFEYLRLAAIGKKSHFDRIHYNK